MCPTGFDLLAICVQYLPDKSCIKYLTAMPVPRTVKNLSSNWWPDVLAALNDVKVFISGVTIHLIVPMVLTYRENLGYVRR